MGIPEQSQYAGSHRRMREDVRDRISRSFLTASDNDVYGEVLDAVLNAMHSPSGVLGYLDENGNLVCPSGGREILGQSFMADGSATVFPRSSWLGIWGRSLLEGRAFYSNTGSHKLEGNAPVERALSVPLINRGCVIGLLSVVNKAGDYDEADKARLEDIAGFVAPFLDARLQRVRQEEQFRTAEEALRLSEERNRTIFETALDGFWIVDRERRIVDCRFESKHRSKDGRLMRSRAGGCAADRPYRVLGMEHRGGYGAGVGRDVSDLRADSRRTG
jgi:hypothetical protein